MEQRPAWVIFAEHWWTVEVIYLPWGRFLLAERARGQREIHDETSLTVLRAVERLLLEELRWSARFLLLPRAARSRNQGRFAVENAAKPVDERRGLRWHDAAPSRRAPSGE